MDCAAQYLIDMDSTMSIELTQKVIRLEATLKSLLDRLEELENRYTVEDQPEEKKRRGRRSKNENE